MRVGLQESTFAAFAVWLRPRAAVTGVLWGLVQNGVIWIPTMMGFSFPQLPLMAVPVALFFGYLLRDIERSIKALVVSQLIAWVSFYTVIWFTSEAFRGFWLASNPAAFQGVGRALFLSVGLGIFWFFFGMLGSILGSVVGGFIEARRRASRPAH